MQNADTDAEYRIRGRGAEGGGDFKNRLNAPPPHH